MKTINKKILKMITASSLLSLSIFSISSNTYKVSNGNLKNDDVDNQQINNNEDTNLLSSDPGRIFPENYQSIFSNRYTQPVVSSDPNNPGFMGVVNSSSSNFYNQITWTGENGLFSWAQDITKHPEIARIGFTRPVLISAIHSDNGKTSNYTNQLILLIADEANLASNKYALIRYNSINGNPIVNVAPDSTTPIPSTEMTINIPNTLLGSLSYTRPSSSTPYGLSIIPDHSNKRYIVYYPGKVIDMTTNARSFTIDNNNNITINNNPFTGVSGNDDWLDGSGSSPYYKENILLGMAASPISNSLVLYILMTGSDPNINIEYNVFGMEVNADFSFNPLNSAGIESFAKTDGIYNNFSNILNLVNISLSTFWTNYSPFIAVNSAQGTYSASMIINIYINSKMTYSRISFNKSTRDYRMLNEDNGFALSKYLLIQDDVIYPNPSLVIWYNPKKQLEVIISRANSTTQRSFIGTKLSFDDGIISNANDLNPTILNMGEMQYNDDSYLNFKGGFIESIHNSGVMFFSSNQNQQGSFYIDNLTRYNFFTSTGGLTYNNPQNRAQQLGWLAEFIPSQISDNRIIYNSYPNNKPSMFNQNYLYSLYLSKQDTFNNGVINTTPNIAYDIVKDDQNGTIIGNVHLTYTHNGIRLKSIHPINVSGFKTAKGETNFIISNQNAISNSLPSQVNQTNWNNFFSVVNLPEGATTNIVISNVNNKTGSLTIQATVSKYNDNNNNTIDRSKTFDALNITSFARMPGTIIRLNPSNNVSEITVWDVDSTTISNYVIVENSLPNNPLNVTYSISNQKPLEGTLTVTATVTGGFYDPSNNGLPNPTPTDSNSISLPLNITGFKRVGGATSITTRNGVSTISPDIFVKNPNSLLPFFTINNNVPSSTATISNVEATVDTGTVAFNLRINRVYNSDGTINSSGRIFNLIINGFKQGISNKQTDVIQISNPTVSQSLFPEEVNDSNINRFLTIINAPDNAKIQYEFLNRDNLDTNQFGGSLNVKVSIQPYINNLGITIQDKLDFNVSLRGFKALSQPTNLIPKPGNSFLYAQQINIGEISSYYELAYPSEIPGMSTSIEIISDSIEFNNFTGSLLFNYKIRNYFDSTTGSLVKTEKIQPLEIKGFKKLLGSTSLSLKTGKNISNIVPSEFNQSEWKDYFDFNNVLESTNTTNAQVEKISTDNEKGTVTFKVSNVSNYIDERGAIIGQTGSFTTVVSGFKPVPSSNETLYIIIGSSIGGLILLIAIIGAILLILNKRKNNKTLNKKDTTPSKSNSTSTPSSMNKPITPINSPNSMGNPTRPIPPTSKITTPPVNKAK